METTKNLRALYLAKILYEQTDEDHPLSTNQLIEALQNEFGVSAHRVTIYEDMEQLRSFGLDIYTVKSTQNKYYLAERLFDLPELKLLIDAVESSKFITAKKSEELVGKIAQLSSRSKADELKRTLYAEGRIKPENEKIYYIVDAIHAAINAGKKISFSYFQYNGRKQQKLKNSGAEYVCSPWMLVWNATSTGLHPSGSIASPCHRTFSKKTPYRSRRILTLPASTQCSACLSVSRSA